MQKSEKIFDKVCNHIWSPRKLESIRDDHLIICSNSSFISLLSPFLCRQIYHQLCCRLLLIYYLLTNREFHMTKNVCDVICHNKTLIVWSRFNDGHIPNNILMGLITYRPERTRCNNKLRKNYIIRVMIIWIVTYLWKHSGFIEWKATANLSWNL